LKPHNWVPGAEHALKEQPLLARTGVSVLGKRTSVVAKTPKQATIEILIVAVTMFCIIYSSIDYEQAVNLGHHTEK
jgi:hypothetical protein